MVTSLRTFKVAVTHNLNLNRNQIAYPREYYRHQDVSILIGRLNSLGFSNDCLAWFTNYFSDIVQCVKSEGLWFGPLAVSMGVSTRFNSQADSLLCIYQ